MPPEATLRKEADRYILTVKNNGKTVVSNLLYIEKGSFTRQDGVEIKLSPFYMGETTVTQELYEAVTGNTPSRFKGFCHPVEKVTWYDAIDFCQKLNLLLKIEPPCYQVDKQKKDENNKDDDDKLKWTVTHLPQNAGFRLPTEAQWEYAARAGENTKYAASNILENVGWYEQNNYYETKPVAQKFPNKFGLYDMSGNVWEWCWDWYGNYDKNVKENPQGAPPSSNRVLRGGSWYGNADRCRVAFRGISNASNRYSSYGFRLVRSY